jgi:MYXO-CTERM domain-containing protein
MEDNFVWALDPNSSCEEPGCSDPWGGPPITWTFKDGSMEDPPGFDAPTFSHMPRCDGANFCSGSGTYTHLGLQLVKDNQAAYLAEAQMMDAPYPANDGTPFINILIVDGQYTGYSTDAQVQAELEDMYNAGITTYVIGFGDAVNAPQAEAQLANMASWGSGGMKDWYDANDDAELSMALAAIAAEIDYDPCCAFADCSNPPEPNPTDPDPVPPPTTDSGDTGTETDSGGTSTDGGSTGTDGGSTSTDGGSTSTDGGGTEGTSGDSDTSGDGGTETGGDGGTSGGGGVDEVGDDTGTGTGDDAGVDSDEGCNCSTASDAERNGGVLGVLLAFGLVGFSRRRRSG